VKKLNFLFVCVVLVSMCLITGSNASAQTLDKPMTNDEVISLAGAGLNSSIIVNKIKTSNTNFDLSTDALIKLKKAGVTDDVVNAMLEAKSGKAMAVTTPPNQMSPGNANLNDPTAPHDFGIYLFEDRAGESKMTRMSPIVSQQNRTGGIFTSSMTYGISKVKTKANLPGTAATLQLKDPRPVFYFYLDAKSGGLNTSSGVPSTPSEFALIKFNIRSDNREVTIAKANAFGGKGGLSDEYVVQFDSQDMGNGVFKITPKADLKNGEYGFYLINSGGSNAAAAMGAKFFDFGVKLVP
jgi:hypothetical protein